MIVKQRQNTAKITRTEHELMTEGMKDRFVDQKMTLGIIKRL